MINFIIDNPNIKEIIHNIMMNYNYQYSINSPSTIPKTSYNIYILTYNNQTKIKTNSIMNHIRHELNDWLSIIILLDSPIKLKQDILNKKLFLLDVIEKNSSTQPLLKEDIKISLTNFFKREDSLKYNYKNIFYNIPYQDILYIENDSINKRCLIKTTEVDIYIPGSLTKIYNNLDKRFIKCSRSYILNIQKVKKYDKKNNIIYFSKDIKIYEISRAKKNEIANILRGVS